MTKAEFKVPKYSYAKGWPDEGISEALDKPSGFRYSERFLKDWYSDKIYTMEENPFNGIMWGFILLGLLLLLYAIWRLLI